ncbi:velvet factor-domain-containing protein [Rhypophila decipiens]|uniref:Velvet factor-domain-containing protein n=1 Tax=Rhypophila decipiens TaxID=261697 RepID=A0AAN6YG95_9PEZI|nr:velvet factor-domain-containing protein [Rhypophila decipiens]
MSTVVEFAPHNFGRHHLLDGMARPPHHSYHEAYAPKHGYYAQEQQQQQPPPPRLPSMAAMISSAVPSHPSAFSNGRDIFHSSSRQGYYSDYATPSPVGQTPPQFPGPSSSDVHPLARRPVDVRRSPTLSSTASDRSSDEAAQEMRLRQINSLREHHNHGQMPARPYHHLHQQSPPRSRGSSFHHEGNAQGMNMPAAYMTGPHGRSASPTGPQSPPSTQPSASPRQETKSMSISNLLSSDSHSNSSSKKPMQPSMRPSTSSSEYKITVRQQPFAARSCGFGERDRRVIDPPPIVQLSIHDDSLSPDDLGRRLRHQFSVVHCSIWDEEGNKDMSSMPEDFRQQRRLMGTLVASPFVGQDEDGQEGCFFCFPDLSCRTPGTFRLKFALVVLDPTKMHHGDRSAIVATAMSEPFQVYNAKDFPGMKASTPLTKRLKEQGCLISIKKGNEKGGSSHGRGGDDSGEDEDDDEGEPKARSRKRQKRSGV